MENVLSAAEKTRTIRRVVFTQSGAALVNTDDGDMLGIAMDKIINGTYANIFPPCQHSC